MRKREREKEKMGVRGVYATVFLYLFGLFLLLEIPTELLF